MIRLVIDEPYQFIPPDDSTLWPTLFKWILPHYLNKYYGITSSSVENIHYLEDSLQKGHGILLTPNHCRPSDPFAIGLLGRKTGCLFNVMASWHLFKQSHVQTFLLKKMGAFSVYREGMDRASINQAIKTLVEAERPLVLFPEGVISRTNDILHSFQEGTALIARMAAKKRAAVSKDNQVVVHPVALRYHFHGNLGKAIEPILEKMEQRLTWQPQKQLGMDERLSKVAYSILCLKEIEYFGQPQQGERKQRLQSLIDQILHPLEEKWLKAPSQESITMRVKKLRAAILPDLISKDIDITERDKRWRMLADCYLAQNLSHYHPGYLKSDPSGERRLEIIERIEEDITDSATKHAPLSVKLIVGKPIKVSPEAKSRTREDPLIIQMEEALQDMLDKSK